MFRLNESSISVKPRIMFSGASPPVNRTPSSWLAVNAGPVRFIDPASAFDPSLNVRMVIMTLFGGPGTVMGPVLGALILSAVSEVLASQATGVASLFYGIVIVAAVVLMPKGLLDVVVGVRERSWRYFADNVRRFRI